MFVVCSVCVTSVYVAGCVIMMCVSVCNVFFYAYTVCVYGVSLWVCKVARVCRVCVCRVCTPYVGCVAGVSRSGVYGVYGV